MTRPQLLLLDLAAQPQIEVRWFKPLTTRPQIVAGRFAASPFDFGRLNPHMHNEMFISCGAVAMQRGFADALEWHIIMLTGQHGFFEKPETGRWQGPSL